MHEHTFTDGWTRGSNIYRACKCGVYDNPNVLESDFVDYSVRQHPDPFEGLTGND